MLAIDLVLYKIRAPSYGGDEFRHLSYEKNIMITFRHPYAISYLLSINSQQLFTHNFGVLLVFLLPLHKKYALPGLSRARIISSSHCVHSTYLIV